MTEKTEPVKRFKAGNCTASVFVNKTQKDGEEISIKTATLQKSYKDKDGNWQNNNTFNRNDLPKIIRAAEQAYDYLLTEQ